MQTRFRVYDRLGAERGQLPNPLEAVWVPPLNSVPTLTIHYSLLETKSDLLLDFPEVAFEYWDEDVDDWVEPFNARFKFFEEDFDHLEDTPTKSYTFLGIGEILLGQTVYERYGRDLNEDGRVQFKETNAGEIMSFIWDNAESRGWQGFEYDFSVTTDSNGQPWAQVFNISYDTDTNLANILDGLVRQGAVDYVWVGRTLRMYNAHTYLAREMSTGDEPVLFNLSGGPAGVDAAPEMTNTENLATHVIVLGENNLRWVFETGAILPEGRREVVLQYSGVNDVGTARILADPVILKSVSPLMNTTRQFHLTDDTKIKPLIDYRIGDWCLIERQSEYQRMRIISMSLWVNQNGVHGYVTLGDKIDDALEQMYQRIQGLTGGKANEGTGAPPLPKNRTPKIPTNLLVSAEAYPSGGGEPAGLVAVSLAHSFLDTMNDPINIDHFEIQMKEVVTYPDIRSWSVATRIYAPETSGTVSSMDIYDRHGNIAQYDFKAFAISDDGRRSGESATVRLTMVEDSVPPPIPSTPSVQAQGATFTITSDGLGSVGEAMPRDYSTSHVQMGTSETGPWESVGMITGRDSLTIPSGGYHTRWFRMYSVDTTGNESDPSGVVSATTAPLVPQSVFDQTVTDINADIGANVDDLLIAKDVADEALADAEQALLDAEQDRIQAAIDLAAAEVRVKEAAALDAQARADTAKANAITAAAEAAQAEYERLEDLAEAAEDQALAAAGLAADQGKVWPQPTEPPEGVTYEWAGAANNSSSIKFVEGVESRRNVAFNPSAEGTGNLWNEWGDRVTVDRITDIARSGIYSTKVTVVSDLAGNPQISSSTGWLPGDTVTASMYLWATGSSVGKIAQVYMRFEGVPAAGVTGPAFTLVEGWNRISVTNVMHPEANGAINVQLQTAAMAIGDIVYIDDLLIEKSDTVNDYFDGSFPDDRQNDLWIDTDLGNTPHTWDPVEHVWVASTDQNVIDAANSAAASETAAETAAGNATAAQQAAETAQGDAAASNTAAQQAKIDANNAAAAAETARLEAEAAALDAANAVSAAETAALEAENSKLAAEAAQRTADGKTTISTNEPTVADLTDKPGDSMWTQVVDGKVVGAWYKATADATVWTPMPFDPVMIPQINIGTGTFGELDGVRLKAKTVGTRELVVADYENYLPLGTFEPGAPAPISLDPYHVISTAKAYEGTRSLHVLPETVSPSPMRTSFLAEVPTQAGHRWSLSFRTNCDAAYSAQLNRIEVQDQNGVSLGNVYIQATSLTDTWRYRTTDINVPAGVLRLQIKLITQSNTTGNVWIDSIDLMRRGAGVVYVDGTVKADQIDTNSLTADSGFIDYLESRLVKADLFVGKAFQGGTFTGPIIQTNVEANKGIKHTPDGITAYTSTGAVGFSLAASTGRGIFSGRVGTAMGDEPGSTLLPASDSDNGKTSGMFITHTSTLVGQVSAGVWVPDTQNTSGPQEMYIRGWFGGGIVAAGRILKTEANSSGMGDFLSYAVKPSSQQSYIPDLMLPEHPTTSSGANALVAVTPVYGRIYRSTSSLYRKADVQPYTPEDPYWILGLKESTWVDRNPIDPADPFKRYVGYVAEWTHEVAPEVVTYNEWDEPDAVQYDRMPSPLVLAMLRDMVRRIDVLEGTV